MQFNSEANNQDIVSSVVNSTGLSATNDINRITLASNKAVKRIWGWIFEVYGGWQFVDSNQNNEPEATQNLVSGTSEYTLPSAAITIRAVEVKREGGVWDKLIATTEEMIQQVQAEEEFLKTDGQPQYYVPKGQDITVYPAPNYNLTNGIKFYFDVGSINFDPSDTTEAPGFVPQYHEAVPAGASYFIAKDLGLANTGELKDDWLRYEIDIKKFYKKRYQDMFPPAIHVEDMAQEMI